MKNNLGLWISTIAASVLSGLYWLIFFLFAETWTASDYRAGSAPDETFPTFKVALVFIAGPVVFAVLIAVWRRIGRALLPVYRNDA